MRDFSLLILKKTIWESFENGFSQKFLAKAVPEPPHPQGEQFLPQIPPKPPLLQSGPIPTIPDEPTAGTGAQHKTRVEKRKFHPRFLHFGGFWEELIPLGSRD